ncbi:unnamed protein product [Gongylonema pulchrum]|uniref:Elongation of very long chain fatty acids protein n=1 Tax=Gongylonema pulchrum TaxID=637853 RepID=A0A183EL55_9BILA|nr:unnamed protein product [Gongylonema pulchrum]
MSIVFFLIFRGHQIVSLIYMEEFKRIAFTSPFRHDEASRFTGTLQGLALYVSAAYVILIFTIKLVMTRFKPFQLTTALNLWNTWLAVFSILGSFFTTVALFTEIKNHGLVGWCLLLHTPFCFCA